MCTYHDINATIVWVVRQSLLQHIWYLTEHLVIPAFFTSLRFLVWKKLWLHSTQVHFHPSIPDAHKISWKIHGDASHDIAEYLFFIWMTCNIKNYSLMSLNVTITQPVTLYLLEQYSIIWAIISTSLWQKYLRNIWYSIVIMISVKSN